MKVLKISAMRPLVTLAAAALLCACANEPIALRSQELFNDHLFAKPTVPIRAQDVFAVSDEMKQYLRDTLTAELKFRGRQQGLYDALYKKGQLQLDYDSGMTRNAAEAFAARAGNCLSLVIMTSAFAKEIGLYTRYQSVIVEETWSRSGDLYLSVGHVNLTLGKKQVVGGLGNAESDQMTIDFYPVGEVRRQRARIIGEETIVAMYMNNRAVETLARGNLDDAYWWARAAILEDPHFLTARNTLGVIYQRHRNPAAGERAFRQVLDVEPANTQAMANLVALLNDQGHVAEASTYARKLAQIEPDPPFKFYNLGMAAMEKGDFRAAKEYFEKEVDRAAYYHEFQFWLAMAHLRLGETKQARKHMALALESSTTRPDHDLYAAKLELIKVSTTLR